MVTNDVRERSKRLIHGQSVREDLGHIWLQDHDMTTGHSGGIRVPSPPTEIVLGEDVIRIDALGAPSASLLHSPCVRDESLSEHL